MQQNGSYSSPFESKETDEERRKRVAPKVAERRFTVQFFPRTGNFHRRLTIVSWPREDERFLFDRHDLVDGGERTSKSIEKFSPLPKRFVAFGFRRASDDFRSAR